MILYFFAGGVGGEGNGLINDVIVIGWTDSDFRISRALVQTYIFPNATQMLYSIKIIDILISYMKIHTVANEGNHITEAIPDLTKDCPQYVYINTSLI